MEETVPPEQRTREGGDLDGQEERSVNTDVPAQEEYPDGPEQESTGEREEETVTRYGRVIHRPSQYSPVSGKWVEPSNAMADAFHNYYLRLMELDNEEQKLEAAAASYFSETMAVGAGTGGGFEITAELKVMKYQEAVNRLIREAW